MIYSGEIIVLIATIVVGLLGYRKWRKTWGAHRAMNPEQREQVQLDIKDGKPVDPYVYASAKKLPRWLEVIGNGLTLLVIGVFVLMIGVALYGTFVK